MNKTGRFVDWALRHGRALWILALLLAIPAALRTGWLYAHLRSDLEELLPRESPSVVALQELELRLGGRQFLGVVVDAGTRENMPLAEDFLDSLAGRVRAYPPGLVRSVRTGNDVERAFLDEHAALYVDLDDLRTLRSRIEARRDFEVARETGALLDADEAPPPLDLDELRARYADRLPAAGTSARYSRADLHLSVLLLELGEASAGAPAAGRLLERVKGDVSALRVAKRMPAPMRVGYAGDAVIATEELSALVEDLSVSSVIVVLAVMAAIVVYYRWWRSVIVVVAPLLLATVYSFGLASLPPFGVHSVNSNTAFLGSIIVGNGINFALVLLSAYVEERRRGRSVRDSLVGGIQGARAGTLAAAIAAAVSYAALAITTFQGFRQFGVIGALGMVLAWCTSFLLMPSLIAWLDRDESTRPRPVTDSARISYWLTRGIATAPRLVLLLCGAATVIAAVQISHFRPTDLESDFSRLRRRDTWTSGEGYWGGRMNSVLGEYLTPLVFLADRPDQAESLARSLRAHLDQPPFAGRIATVRTIDDVLPSHQDEKLAELSRLREVATPAVLSALDVDLRRRVERWLAQPLQRLTIDDLPPTFTRGLRERDGSLGRVVLVYPNPSGVWWNADAMATFVGALRDLARASTTPGDSPPRLAGALPLSSDIVGAIRHDGPIASGAALAGVILTVLLLLRSVRRSALVLGALVLGVGWMAGASHLLGVRLNFANFIAFPITFGIGVDYAVNVVCRYESDGSRDMLAAVRSTGAAVALCSLTTVIGYSSLLMAQNRALYLFGLLAVLGEIACLTAALVALPALVLAWKPSRERGRSAAADITLVSRRPAALGTRRT